MIVVVGQAAFLPALGGPGRAAGLAPEIAVAAAAGGAAVELVSRIGDDGVGEELLLALGRAGVGHLAVLRDPARATALSGPEGASDDGLDEDLRLLAESAPESSDGVDGTGPGAAASPSPAVQPEGPAGPEPALEAADLSLGLAYLREYRVVAAVEPLPPDAAGVIAEAARFAGAALVVVAAPGTDVPGAYGSATVFEAPDADPDGTFAALVGRYAAALDGGIAPGDAFREATAAGGWEPVEA